MKQLRQYNESDLLFYDIETSRCAKDYKSLPEPLKLAWEHKNRYNSEMKKKTGEEFTPEEYFMEKAALYAPFAKVACIVAGRITDNVLRLKAYSGPDEKKLLSDFAKDLTSVNAAHVDLTPTGFNSVGFDGPFLTKRMLVNDITLPSLLDQGSLKPWEIVSLDLSKVWQGNSFYPDSLMAVAAALGLANPKTTMHGNEVSDEYYKGNHAKIAEYCAQDVLACANIFRRFLQKSLVTLQP